MLMKPILSILLCAAVLFGCFAMPAVAEEQTVEERVTEMLTKNRVPGRIFIIFRDDATREEVERMLESYDISLSDDELSAYFDGGFCVAVDVGEERIFDVLVALLQDELVKKASPDYVAPIPIEYPRGDVDGDGDVDAVDYMFLKRAVLRTFKLTEVGELCADVNGDGKVNSLDYMLVKRHVLGTFGALGTVDA